MSKSLKVRFRFVLSSVVSCCRQASRPFELELSRMLKNGALASDFGEIYDIVADLSVVSRSQHFYDPRFVHPLIRETQSKLSQDIRVGTRERFALATR